MTAVLTPRDYTERCAVHYLSPMAKQLPLILKTKIDPISKISDAAVFLLPHTLYRVHRGIYILPHLSQQTGRRYVSVTQQGALQASSGPLYRSTSIYWLGLRQRLTTTNASRRLLSRPPPSVSLLGPPSENERAQVEHFLSTFQSQVTESWRPCFYLCTWRLVREDAWYRQK